LNLKLSSEVTAMDHTEERAQAGLRVPRAGALDRRRLRRILEYIERHMEEDLTLDRLAAAVCLSKYHFSRAFKVATGTSPKRYLKERRLDMAKTRLSEETGTLTDIAMLCRFSSEANFSRAFRGATGLTPGRYRRTFTTVTARIRQYLAARVG
jgi:AraC family transcriptional regulator